MKFSIRNVCKVNNAQIDTNGITVIAGYNDTGKSTILKSIDVFLKAFRNKEANIEEERWKSINRLLLKKEVIFDDLGFSMLPRTILYDIHRVLRKMNIGAKEIKYADFKNAYLSVIRPFLNEEFVGEKEELLREDSFIKNLFDGMDDIKDRSAQSYWEYLITLYLRKEFGGQIINFINHKDSVISCEQEEKKVIRFNGSQVQAVGNGMSLPNIIYIETKNLLDDFERQRQEGDLRKYLLKESSIEVYEQYHEIEENKKVLNDIFMEVLHGRLQRDEDSLKYRDERIGEFINLHNVASGMKSLLVIQRLVENGSLCAGSWLLIDEPETNLHPEWHVKMAEILVLMKKEMNINVIVSSHSAYFIRALEVKLAANQMKENGTFYLMEPENDMFDAVDVSENTERIYEQLYKPLEEL